MKPAIGIFIIVMTLVVACQSQNKHKAIPALDFSELLSYDRYAILLDVRTPEEFTEGHIPGARNLDYVADSFESRVDSLDKSKSYFLYCTVGGRSSGAARYMDAKGFEKIHDLEGGIDAWQTEGLPVTTSTEED